jgi:hypothetical protein
MLEGVKTTTIEQADWANTQSFKAKKVRDTPMNACRKCGMEITWRTIDGKKIPMGCECVYGDFQHSSGSSSEGSTRELHCPQCGALVFFVRHNGGSVWLDELGQPWPKHPCYDNQGSTDGLDDFIESRQSRIISKIESIHEKTDLGQRILYVSTDDRFLEMYPSPDFWLISPGPTKGERLEVNSVAQTFRIRDQEFRYWPINVSICGKCSELYLNWKSIREICPARGSKH